MSLRIIIADDHPIVRSGMRELLERSGEFGPMAEAGSPDELVQGLEQRPFDLILTDFNMPGGQITDGLNLLELIRQRCANGSHPCANSCGSGPWRQLSAAAAARFPATPRTSPHR